MGYYFVSLSTAIIKRDKAMPQTMADSKNERLTSSLRMPER
jgi:hypothetical protein